MSSESKKEMNEYLEMALITAGVIAVMSIYAVMI